jgi:hypothetical protein
VLRQSDNAETTGYPKTAVGIQTSTAKTQRKAKVRIKNEMINGFTKRMTLIFAVSPLRS